MIVCDHGDLALPLAGEEGVIRALEEGFEVTLAVAVDVGGEGPEFAIDIRDRRTQLTSFLPARLTARQTAVG